MTPLNDKAHAIHERAQALTDSLPVHLKLMPEIKQTLALMQDISALLVLLTHTMTEGE